MYLLFAKNRVKVHLHVRVCMMTVRKLKDGEITICLFHSRAHARKSTPEEFERVRVSNGTAVESVHLN